MNVVWERVKTIPSLNTLALSQHAEYGVNSDVYVYVKFGDSHGVTHRFIVPQGTLMSHSEFVEQLKPFVEHILYGVDIGDIAYKAGVFEHVGDSLVAEVYAVWSAVWDIFTPTAGNDTVFVHWLEEPVATP